MEVIEKIIGVIILAFVPLAYLLILLGGFVELYGRSRRNRRKEIFLDRIVDSIAVRIICPVLEFIADLVDRIKWWLIERKTDLVIMLHKVIH